MTPDLAAQHSGLEIDIKFAIETLKNVYTLWQRPCHIQARIDDEQMLFTFDGHQGKQKLIRDDTPQPAHAIH